MIDQRKHQALHPILIALLVAALLHSGLASTEAANPVPGFGSIIPTEQPAIQTETAGRLSSYALDASFSPAQTEQLAVIKGTLALHFVNATGAAQSTIYLRLYPNSVIYPAGGMTVEKASIDGTATKIRLSVHDTVAAMNLPVPIAPGASTDLAISFATKIPTDPQGTYGMFEFDSKTGVYALANWFPILAGFDPERGWLLDPPATIGDPVFANDAMFDVRLSAPWMYKIAAGGTEIGRPNTAGNPERHFVAGPVRDFVITISDEFQSVSQNVGKTVVKSYFLPEDAPSGSNALVFGARALKLYERRYGAYPYQTMSLVETPLGSGAGGVEFPQLVFLGADYYADGSAGDSATLEFLVSHEVAHQWFYGLVCNDQYLHAFLDEALANVSAVLDLKTFRGADAAATVMNRSIVGPYRSYLESRGDLVVDAPSEDFPSVLAYNAVVYGKAVMGFQAIRDKIGQTEFDAALALYVSRNRFATAVPSDLLACLNESSGQDLTALWDHWFEQTHGLTDLNIAQPGTPVSEPGR